MSTQSVTSSGRRSELWGWFGGQVGSTIWLICVACRLGLNTAPKIFWLLLACFVVPNLIGLALWFRRQRIGRWLALRLLLVVIAVCDLAGMILLRDRPEFSDEISPRTFVVFGVVMIAIFVIFQRRASHDRDA
jgi:hypothetical protein